MTHPTKAVHSWALHRTLGSYVAAGAMPMGGLPAGGGGGLALLDLPAELARRGYGAFQLAHFYLPSTDPGYLADLRSALSEANVELECFLIDDGDPTDTTGSAPDEDWVSGWLDVAAALGAPRARVVAGKSEPTPLRLDASAGVLRRLADRHPELRVVTENWHALLPNADAVIALLERTEDRVGFLVDLGNWRGPSEVRRPGQGRAPGRDLSGEGAGDRRRTGCRGLPALPLGAARRRIRRSAGHGLRRSGSR